MTDKRIVFRNTNGSCGIIIPSPKWEGTLEELAEKDVPFVEKKSDWTEDAEHEQGGYFVKVWSEQLPWRIVTVDQIPSSRNWRNAWTDDNTTKTVDVVLEKAKQEHPNLMLRVIRGRLEQELPEWQLETAIAELKNEIQTTSIVVQKAKNLDELYNIWVKKHNKRQNNRKYSMHPAEGSKK